MKITVDHVVLEVRDVEVSARFYETLLGFPPVRLEQFRAGGAPFASARVNKETIIDLFPKSMWISARAPRNPNHVCFTMDRKQVEALKRRMKKQNVPILRRLERSFGAQGIARSIYFEDPDKVVLEARYYPPSPVARRKPVKRPGAAGS